MDDDFCLDILYDDGAVFDELYKLVQHDLCTQLDIRLHEITDSINYLTVLRRYDNEQLSLLMVAALNGYDDIVRVLLTHYNSIHQVELKGQIKISDKKRINGATALYCACYRGHFTVAKTLIELGTADVNQDTDEYPYYPLSIHAVIMNRCDIVHFLFENKYADVNETKSTDNDKCTAIIWAAFRGYTSLIEYLIANGADVNYSCQNENLKAPTAITCAAMAGHVDAIRVLYNAGANINIKDQEENTILTTAVRHKYYSIINFLLEQSINTVEDLELAACLLINNSSPSIGQMHDVLELLKIALQRRELLCMPKVCVQSMDIYDYKQECQTIDELDDIKNDPDRVFLETLLIRERICLSRNDITIIKPLHNYGDKLVYRNGEFDKCINLWIHMFYLYQRMKMGTILHRFVWVFCRMLTANQQIPVERFLQVCRLIFEPSQMEDMNLTLCNALFLVIIATKILGQQGITEDEQRSIYRWIKDLCRFRSIDSKTTLLHICVDVQTNTFLSFRETDTSPYLKFPNEFGLRLLLACGGRWLDINAKDSPYSNTPLHIICANTKERKIIELLLNAGCHLDCVNKYGYIPVDYIEEKETRALLISKPIPLNLKCLCARIIANQRLNTECLGTSRSYLNKFIVMHDNGSHIQSDESD